MIAVAPGLRFSWNGPMAQDEGSVKEYELEHIAAQSGDGPGLAAQAPGQENRPEFVRLIPIAPAHKVGIIGFFAPRKAMDRIAATGPQNRKAGIQ